MFGQLLLSSLAMGSIYALIALAMVLVYKASEVPNFAQGEMALVSAYLFFGFYGQLSWPFVAALLATLLSATLLGWLYYHLILRRARHPKTLDLVLLTLGFQFLLHGLVGWKWGAEQHPFPFPISNQDVVRRFGLSMSHLDVAVLGVALSFMLGLYAFFRSKWGLALRATQQNPEAARFNGVPRHKMLGLTWSISALVGSSVGILLAPVTSLDPTLLWEPALKGFAAAVLGGLHSLPGAVLGGFLLALLENVMGSYFSTEFKSVAAFLVIVLVLSFRPQGLLGQVPERVV